MSDALARLRRWEESARPGGSSRAPQTRSCSTTSATARAPSRSRPPVPNPLRRGGADLDDQVLGQRLVALRTVVGQRAQHVQLWHVPVTLPLGLS